MRSIRKEIIIQAPAQTVWRVLTDFAAYPEWNPFIHTKGEAKAGTWLENTMFLEGRSPQTFRPRVLVAEAGRELRWLGRLFFPGIFDGEHYFLLEALDGRRTRLIQGEHFRGILAGLLLKMIGRETEAAFEKMNLALKERAESLS